LFGIVSRLTYQKGIDLVIQGRSVFSQSQLIILGQGEENIENQLEKLAASYPSNIKAFIKFDPILAQKIYAGCDMFLMPSRFEPCGLGQLISLRYGTIPIVNQVGGLKDTIKNIQIKNHRLKGNGFVFKQYDLQLFLQTIKKAIKYYQQKNLWQKIIAKAMQQNFSWEKSAKKYLKIYQKLNAKK